ncbi:MAG: hypothetical protein FWF84_03935 [Kiritimatiellaeota bacterium]|nr:hypothetical protein [Kiritimatiellota bacterium]
MMGLNTVAKGWNTWNTRSVLNHVLLPEGIALSLGFKHYAGGDYLRNALIGRSGEHDEKIHPGARTYDGRYTDMTLAWKGCTWRIQSAVEGGDLVVLVESVGARQVKTPLVVAELGMLWNRPGMTWREGAALCAAGGRTSPCAVTVAVYPTGAVEEEPYVDASSPYLGQAADGVCGFSTGRKRSVEEIRAIVATAAAERAAEDASFGDAAEIRNAMQCCLAWDTVYDPLHDRVISPVSRIWNANWGGYVMFCWDSYFAALMAAVDNKELAYANAVAITKEGVLRGNGMVPNFVNPSNYCSRDRSQPPVGSFTVLTIYKKYKETKLLEWLFDDLLTWNRWWPRHRDMGGLLAWGSDPYTPVVGNAGETGGVNTLSAAALESGLDNAPMYDAMPYDAERHCMMLQDAGLNGLYVWDCDCLAEIARTLGRTAEAEEVTARAEHYRTALKTLWDEESGIFLNRRTDTGEFSHRLSPTNFYPLLAKAATQAQAERMMQEHFFNPQEFWGEWIMPSCSRNDPAYPDQNYWRGRIWAPMNFLVYAGLRHYDLPEARKAMADKSAALLLKEWREKGHVHENYSGDDGTGCGNPHSDAFYHWGGLLGLIALMEKK